MPGLQNSISAPTPMAVNKGGTGNTTPTFSTGPLTVSTVGYRAPNGSSSAPAYSFVGNTDMGMYKIASPNDLIGISCNGKKVGEFSETSTSGVFAVYSNSGPYAGIECISTGDGESNIFFSSNIDAGVAISINGSGAVTLPIGPLTLSTGQILAPDGSASAPAYSFTGSTSTGFYRSTAVGNSIGLILGSGVGNIFEYNTSANTVTFHVLNTPRALSLIANNTSNTGVIRYGVIDSITIQVGGDVTINQDLTVSGNATVQGNLTLSTGKVLAPNGSAGAPTYSFSSDSDTGIYESSTGELSVASDGRQVATFSGSSSTSLFQVKNGSNFFNIFMSTTTTEIGCQVTAITFNTTGGITLAQALPIASGGTNATTQAAAIKNLMPSATVNGTLAYYNGTNWVVLAPPAAGTYFLKITSGGTGTGGTPFWSLT